MKRALRQVSNVSYEVTGYPCGHDRLTCISDLVDTFLLPALVLALSYMASQLWSDISQEKKAIIRVLQLILLTKQGSNEAQSMLSAVLNIVAKPLEHALRLSQRQNPKSQEIEPLLRAIKDNTRFSRRTAGAGHNELEAWTSTQGGGLAAAVRHTVQGFVQWALQPSLNVMPTAYTHRQILAAQKILGARRLLQVILDEVRQLAEAPAAPAGSGSVAYDVATALVCAPDVTNVPPPPETIGFPPQSQHQHQQDGVPPPQPPPQARLSLRQALRFEAEDFKAVQKRAGGDPAAAEAVVRLHRRVEAQLLAPPQPHDDVVSAAAAAEALGLAGPNGPGGDADRDAATAAAEAELNSALEAAAAANGAGAGAGNGAGAGAGGLDDDIFGGLGTGADILDGWDLMQ